MTTKWAVALERLGAEQLAAKERCRIERDALKQAKERLRSVMKAQVLCEEVAAQIQSLAHKRIAEIVTQCLQAIFDDPYVFKIRFERKRDRTEARLVFERNGLEVDPLTASGGGVVDVAAFALRLACLGAARPAPRKLLLLDEPFKYVKPTLRPRVSSLLLEVAEEIGVQIVLVTHDQELQVGSVVNLGSSQ